MAQQTASEVEPVDVLCDSATASAEPLSVVWAFTGARLRAVRDREERPSPLPGILDPEPHLHLIAGRPKSGKTTFALLLAKSWAEGRAPWPGAPELPGSRALVISREQPVRRIANLLRRLDQHSENRDAWPDRMLVVARDPESSPEAKSLLCLDEKGLRALRQRLQALRDEGDPVGLVVLDSLSRLKPTGVEEIDNDAMSSWLDQLEQIALEFNAYLLLIHHQGHGGGRKRQEARSAARGASSIGAVASVSMLLERVSGQPRRRRLSVDGSFVLEGDLLFEVCEEGDKPGTINFFRLVDPYAVYDPESLIGPDLISKNELAWRLSGRERREGGNPSGSAARLATELCKRWEKEDRIAIQPGPRKSLLIALKSDLATSPSPAQGTVAQSGNLTSPCVPYRHTQGEVDEDSRRDGPAEMQGKDDQASPGLGDPAKSDLPGDSPEGLGTAPADAGTSASPRSADRLR